MTSALPPNAGEEILLQLLRSGHQARFRAQGESMLPVIPPNTEVLIAPCRASEISPGDVVLFQIPEGENRKLFLHRHLGVIPRPDAIVYVFKGDSLSRNDPPVAAENILGKIVDAPPLQKTHSGSAARLASDNSYRGLHPLALLEHEISFLKMSDVSASAEELREVAKILRNDFVSRTLVENTFHAGLCLLIWHNYRLKKVEASLPERVLEAGEKFVAENLPLSLEFAAALENICAAFNRAEIPYAAVKGGFLAHAVYPDSSLRPMSDLDFLVDGKFRARAEALMQEIGYALDDSDQPSKRILPYKIETAFKSQSGNVAVELHWDMSPFACYRRAPMEEILRERAFFTLGKTSCATLSPEWNLLYTAVHLVKHLCGVRLIWLADLRDFLRVHSGKIDWEKLARLAKHYKLFFALRVMFDLGNVAIPATANYAPPVSFLQRMSNALPEKFERTVYDHCLNARHEETPWLEFLSQPGLRKKAGYLFVELFPGREVLRRKYPHASERWLFLRYFQRLWELARRAAKIR